MPTGLFIHLILRFLRAKAGYICFVSRVKRSVLISVGLVATLISSDTATLKLPGYCPNSLLGISVDP